MRLVNTEIILDWWWDQPYRSGHHKWRASESSLLGWHWPTTCNYSCSYEEVLYAALVAAIPVWLAPVLFQYLIWFVTHTQPTNHPPTHSLTHPPVYKKGSVSVVHPNSFTYCTINCHISPLHEVIFLSILLSESEGVFVIVNKMKYISSVTFLACFLHLEYIKRGHVRSPCL
jgi:hypothetical protein